MPRSKTAEPVPKKPTVFTASAVARHLGSADPASSVRVLVGDKHYEIDVVAIGSDGIVILGVTKARLRRRAK